MAVPQSVPSSDATISTTTRSPTTSVESTLTAKYYAMRHSMPSQRPVDAASLEPPEARRYSAPVMATPLWPGIVVPESILVATDVSIAGAAQRGDHCVYLVEVESGAFGAHVLEKRYSEIRDLRAAVLQGTPRCGHGACAQLALLARLKFPRRRLQLPGRRRDADLAVAQQRLPSLERFLQAMLRVFKMASRRELRACNNAQCGALDVIKQFLDVHEPVQSDPEDSSLGSYWDPTASPVMSVDYKVPLGRAPVSGPHSYPGTLRGSQYSAPLCSIEEQSETAAH